jgi:hypothetical protein
MDEYSARDELKKVLAKHFPKEAAEEINLAIMDSSCSG